MKGPPIRKLLKQESAKRFFSRNSIWKRSGRSAAPNLGVSIIAAHGSRREANLGSCGKACLQQED
jgi:hypothetical protein